MAHETATVAGVTEACRYNEHTLCQNSKCGCDCHKGGRLDNQPSPLVSDSVADMAQLKSCPKCETKRPSGERYCRKCGTKLGSLICPACEACCEPGDIYCYNCGMPMTAEARELAKDRKPDLTMEPQPAVPAMPPRRVPIRVPAPVLTEQVASTNEQEVLRALQANGDGTKQAAGHGPVERTFSLPSGTFKITSKVPPAGRVRKK